MIHKNLAKRRSNKILRLVRFFKNRSLDQKVGKTETVQYALAKKWGIISSSNLLVFI